VKRILPAPIIGALSLVLYIINTLFVILPLLVTAFGKLIIPLKAWTRICDKLLNGIASSWISVNNFNQKLTGGTKIDVEGLYGLSTDQWYLVISNHQSWVDILILQNIFNRRIPFLKFFLKQELIWVPVLGIAWRALDFPFMKRYSRATIEKKPHLKGKDLEITRKACKKFKNIPVSVMNFVEGTRFKPTKHQRQQSPFKNLLRPKSGGLAFVLSAMGEQLNCILNVTIAYPEGVKTFWEFLCGKVGQVIIRIESIPITDDLLGDYFENSEDSTRFQKWLNSLWAEKDELLDVLLSP
jgi:1-acyl-sn-glycerol-3-phosphate acyltransferase